jgi:exodeoxyribonuclease-3
MKIVTWNVNGIRARKEDVAALLARERPDVLCLQEIKALPGQVPDVLSSPDYWCYWHGMKGYSGVAILVRKEHAPDQPRFLHPEFDHETRIVVADLDGLSVASIYVPNGGKDFPAKIGFLRAMEAYVADARAIDRTLVLCGDLNVARAERDVHPSQRNPQLVGQRPDERALIERILERGGLRDIGRELDPDNDNLFTWWAPWRNQRDRNIGWRLDYVLASAGLAKRAVSAVSEREIGTSDHAPVIVTFAPAAPPPAAPPSPAPEEPAP